jgi:carbon storage regulator
MLILSRRVHECIMIGDFIRITVIRIESDTVKIGIEAPKEIHVFRSEIYPGRQSYLEARRDESGSLIPDMIDRTTRCPSIPSPHTRSPS